jgi:hypothetical protein
MVWPHSLRCQGRPKHLLRLASAGALGVALVGLPRPAPAQDLVPGNRVRVTLRGGVTAPLVGTLLRASVDSLWVAPQGQAQPTAVARGAAIRLERSLGRRPHTLTGALVGAGVGAGITLLFLSRFCGGDTVCNGDEQVRAAAILGLPCVGLGASLGALIRTERWARLPLGGPSPGPTLQLGLHVGWSQRDGR